MPGCALGLGRSVSKYIHGYLLKLRLIMSRARAKPGSDTITNTNSTGTGSGSSSRRAIITASASLGSSVLPKSSKFRGVTLFRPTGKWRAQISLGGQTTSLGDHDTEHEAARAFDRAALHFKGNGYAATNFGIGEYARELPELMRMSQAELVAELRARARKGRPVSSFRGVSRAWQSSRWHAQITIAGKQVCPKISIPRSLSDRTASS